MYRRILLAYDGSTEGRRALREGALLARRCGAEVYLLSVANAGGGILIGEMALSGAVAIQHEQVGKVLEEGVKRLSEVGFHPKSRLTSGDPSAEICAYAKEIRADLVVVGHRKKGMLERWWSGSSGAWLSDQLGCSLLISHTEISDARFDAEIRATRPPEPVQWDFKARKRLPFGPPRPNSRNDIATATSVGAVLIGNAMCVMCCIVVHLPVWWG